MSCSIWAARDDSAPRDKKSSRIDWDAALFDKLPAEILQQIAEYTICNVFGATTDYEKFVHRLLQEYSFSAAFASAALNALLRIGLVYFPASALLGLAQAAPNEPPLVYYKYSLTNRFWEQSEQPQPPLHRELSVPIQHLRNLLINISPLEAALRPFPTVSVCGDLSKILPGLHHVFPTLQKLLVSVIHTVGMNRALRASADSQISRRRVVSYHGSLFQLTVALNRLQKRVHHVEVIYGLDQINVGGRWSDVMERLRTTNIFCNMEFQEDGPFLFLAWLDLGDIRTRRSKESDANGDFQIDDLTIFEDRKRILYDYLNWRYGLYH